jgi:hypothetical protein
MWERTRNPVTLLMNVHDDRLQEAARERLQGFDPSRRGAERQHEVQTI